jgi:hypothetical protein
LPVTGSELFGREEDTTFLDRVWANKEVNVVTIVAWAGVRKSTLINHWLRRMAVWSSFSSSSILFSGTINTTSSSGAVMNLPLSAGAKSSLR